MRNPKSRSPDGWGARLFKCPQSDPERTSDLLDSERLRCEKQSHSPGAA